jgi:beta-glucanase (GH16 family)
MIIAELQYYTDAPENLSVGGGCLTIRARRESLHGCGYTSARIRTRRRDGSVLFAQTYGRFECRARASVGAGIWPAFWMLPADETYGGWAASGEIDVMELVGSKPHEVLGSTHFGSSYPHRDLRTYVGALPSGASMATFHVYAVEWDPGRIRWLVDGRVYAEQDFWWSSSRRAESGLPPRSSRDLNAWPAPFDRPFYLVLNLAVGGGLPGPPDASTRFPAELVVDYVRVYERRDGIRELEARGAGRVPYERARSGGAGRRRST